MPLNITVVPGKVFADGELVVTSSLNALGQPVITITGSVGGSEIAAGGVDATHVKPGTYFNGVSGGSANAYTLSLSPAPASLADGLWCSFRANHTNTGPATLNLNGLGAVAIKTPAQQALVGGEIVSGQEVWVQYDGTQWQMVSPRSIPQSLWATDSGVANAYAVTLPGITVSTLSQITGIPVTFLAAAACTGASTLAVNGLAATAITKKGSTALSANDIQTGHAVTVVYDGTRFQIVGAMDAPALPSLGTAGTTVYPFAITKDAEGRITNIEGGVRSQTSAVPSGGGSVTFTHGLGRTPAMVRAVLVMGSTTEYGYTAGDEVDVQCAYIDDGTNDFAAFAVVASSTSVVVSRINYAVYVPHKTTGANSEVTVGNWQLKIYAW